MIETHANKTKRSDGTHQSPLHARWSIDLCVDVDAHLKHENVPDIAAAAHTV